MSVSCGSRSTEGVHAEWRRGVEAWFQSPKISCGNTNLFIPRYPFDTSQSGTHSRRLVGGWGQATELHDLHTAPSSIAPVCGCGEGWLKDHTCGVAAPVNHPCGWQAGRLVFNEFKWYMYISSPFPFVLSICVLEPRCSFEVVHSTPSSPIPFWYVIILL